MIRWIGRKLWIGAGLLALLVAALVAIPALIDANAYKPQIVAQMKRATGRDVTIEGPIRLSLLPVPGVSFDGLRVFNVSGAKNPNMVEAKSVSVTLSLLGLLTGELRPAEVTLVEPRIILEIDASGRPNWLFPVAPGSSAVSLPRLVLGTALSFSRMPGRVSPSWRQDADFLASAGSVDGPFSLTGKATVNDVPTTRSGRWGKERCQRRRQSHDRRHPAGGWWQALLCRDSKRVQPERATDGQGIRLRRQPRGFRARADRDGRPAATALASLARRKVQVRWSHGAFADDGLCQRLHAGAGR